MELIERLKALCVDFEAAIDRELISSRIEKTDEFESLALAMIENRTTIIAALQFAEEREEIPMWGAFRPDGSLAFAMPSDDLTCGLLLDRCEVYATRSAAEKAGWTCRKIFVTAARSAVAALTNNQTK